MEDLSAADLPGGGQTASPSNPAPSAAPHARPDGPGKILDADDLPARTGTLNQARKAHARELFREDPDTEAQWKRTLETAIQSIVSIRFIVCRHFDTWQPGTYNATGFLVDAEQGIIMTNKHVTTDGPWVGKVSFRNSEEVPAWVVWRDPIHDFGFLKFDPKAVKYMKLRAIKLVPEAARIGLAVRVPGSDAGEKLAILSGIIARLDRPAASYGVGTYNDLNTFYIQASSNTSGGSSGSPVINIRGEAVALNAGGSSSAASSFFLPLERVKIALENLQRGAPIPRGTLQVEIIQRTYDDCRRLGLPADLESEFRALNADLNGVLSVRHVIPGGPGYGILRTGDLVIKVEGKLLNHFVDLAEILDSAVAGVDPTPDGKPPADALASIQPRHDVFGRSISMTVLRNGKQVTVQVRVQDLHSITPNSYVEIGNSILHPLSFQLARAYLHPCGAVYVADAGHMFALSGIPSFSIIVSVNHIKTPDIATFVKVMRELPNDKRVPVRYYALSKKNVELVKIVTIEKRWGRLRLVNRDDTTGLWKFTLLASPPVAEVPKVHPGRFADFAPGRNVISKLNHKVARSLCVVEFHVPFGTDGTNSKWSEGVGIVVDDKLGLVIVDRSVVTTALGRVFVLFANSVMVPAVVQWIHPQHNFVFVRYDAQLASKIPIQQVVLPDASHGTLLANDEVFLATIHSSTAVPRIIKTTVKSRGYYLFADTHPPKFRTLNYDEAITLHKAMNEDSGAILSEDGVAMGVWLLHPESNSYIGASFETGGTVAMALKAVQESIERNARGHVPEPAEKTHGLPCLRVLDVELTESYYWKARELGLSEEWIARMVRARSTNRRQPGRPVSASMDEVVAAEEVASSDEQELMWEEDAVGDDGSVHEEVGGAIPPGPSRYSFVTVRRVPARVVTSTNQVVNEQDELHSLREGDLILTMNGRLVTRMRDLSQLITSPEDLAAVLAAGGGSPKSVALHILREGREMDVEVGTRILSGLPRVQVVHWAGGIFQLPHRPITFQVKQVPQGVYVSLLYSGSPAQRDGLSACWFVTEVNGMPTPDLESFLEAVGYGEGGKDATTVDPVFQGWPEDQASIDTLRWNDESDESEESTEEDASHASIDGVEESASEADKALPELSPLEVSKRATKSKSYRIRAVSLENVQKVVSVDVSEASKMFWPTWKAIVEAKL